MKDMKTIYRILSAAAAIVLLASCNLDKFPAGSKVYDESVPAIQSNSDLAAFENGVNAYFRSLHQSTYYYVGDLITDGFNAQSDFGNNFGPLHRTDADFTASDQDVEDVWGGYFLAINKFNLGIAVADAIADEDLKTAAQVFKGECFFYRAYSYLYLARYFGKYYDPATAESDLSVPLVTVYDQLARPARATQKAVYDQIKADLDGAAELLADVAGVARSNRPTIDAVNALYARYYLDVRDYAKAAEKAKAVIDTKLYTLASDSDTFDTEFVDDAGNEPILQMFASNKEKPNAMSAYTGLTTFNKKDCYSPYFLPSGKLIDAYDAGDLRLAKWFKKSGDDSYPIRFSGTLHSNPGILVFTKFEGNATYEDNNRTLGRQAVKPLRISEMYLIAAEALFKDGNPGEANDILNELQTNRAATLTTTPSMDAIQKEWFKETVGEGQRYWCLKRWGLGFTARYAQPAALTEGLLSTGEYYTSRAMEASDYHFNLPIPNYEIQINPNLKQNSGYDKIAQ